MGEIVTPGAGDTASAVASGILNQFSMDMVDAVLMIGVDSTAEQTQGNGSWPARLTDYRSTGKPLENIKGLINFGGSGLQLIDYVNGPLDGGFVGPDIEDDTNYGVNNWDTWGHKPTGAVTLAHAIVTGKHSQLIEVLILQSK